MPEILARYLFIYFIFFFFFWGGGCQGLGIFCISFVGFKRITFHIQEYVSESLSAILGSGFRVYGSEPAYFFVLLFRVQGCGTRKFWSKRSFVEMSLAVC